RKPHGDEPGRGVAPHLEVQTPAGILTRHAQPASPFRFLPFAGASAWGGSTFFGRPGRPGGRSPDGGWVKAVQSTPRADAKARMFPQLGSRTPRSHCVTARNDKPALSASCCCVIPALVLMSFKRPPNAFNAV